MAVTVLELSSNATDVERVVIARIDGGTEITVPTDLPVRVINEVIDQIETMKSQEDFIRLLPLARDLFRRALGDEQFELLLACDGFSTRTHLPVMVKNVVEIVTGESFDKLNKVFG